MEDGRAGLAVPARGRLTKDMGQGCSQDHAATVLDALGGFKHLDGVWTRFQRGGMLGFGPINACCTE